MQCTWLGPPSGGGGLTFYYKFQKRRGFREFSKKRGLRWEQEEIFKDGGKVLTYLVIKIVLNKQSLLQQVVSKRYSESFNLVFLRFKESNRICCVQAAKTVKGSNFAHGDQFLSIFKTLIV